MPKVRVSELAQKYKDVLILNEKMKRLVYSSSMLSIFIRMINFVIIFSNTIFNKVSISIICFLNLNVLSRAINFSRQCHFKIWLDCHKF
jgi:hypothetical protein